MVTFVGPSNNLMIPILRPLFDDMVNCEALLEKGDSQFARRSYVRASFAFHEGFLYWLRNTIAETRRTHLSPVSSVKDIAAYLMLLDESPKKPDAVGKFDLEPNRISFLNNCAFVLRSYAEMTDLDPGTLFSDNGWAELRKSLIVRHRITHPKKEEDLEITPEEIGYTRVGHTWLLNCVVKIINTSKSPGTELKEK